jgi:hypothetical protein
LWRPQPLSTLFTTSVLLEVFSVTRPQSARRLALHKKGRRPTLLPIPSKSESSRHQADWLLGIFIYIHRTALRTLYLSRERRPVPWGLCSAGTGPAKPGSGVNQAGKSIFFRPTLFSF